MKQALDRLYATLAHVHGLIDAAQFEEAYGMCLRGEAASVLQALANRGWLAEDDRAALDRHARACLIRTADALLISQGAAPLRQRLRDDPTCRDELIDRFPAPDARGRYHLLELAGEGGMGKVWLARDEGLNRTVALKELKPELADRPDARARFIREAQITGGLEHPFIVPIHELQTDGVLYYAMRLVRGATFADAIAALHGRASARTGDWDQPRLLAVFVQVCQAVAFAHSHGVVHRDLKPANVILGNFGEVFVVDWGLAREVNTPDVTEGESEANAATDSRTTRAGQALGTPAYMSPEQAAGRSQDAGPAADIFGLGAILFEILTGNAPHARHAALPLPEMLARIAATPVPAARRVRSDVPAALEAVCARAMAHQPESRYSSALELAEDVRRWTLGEPVSVHREPWTQRLRRFAVRHRRLTLSSAGILSALACALLAFGVAAWRDGTALEERTRIVLETRAEMQRGDLLSDIVYLGAANRERARSRVLRRLIEQPDPPGKPSQSRRDVAEAWVEQMREQPYLLAFSLIDRADVPHTWIRIQRDEEDRPLTVMTETDAPGAAAALAQTLAELKLGPGPRLIRGSDAEAVVAVVVTALDVAGHDAWVIIRFDFTALMRRMVNPLDAHGMTIVMRNDAGEVLASSGKPETIALYASDAPGDAVDPRLRRFLATDNPEPAARAWADWRQTRRIPPLNSSYQLTLSHCRPNNDIVHAYKIHYSPQVPERYLSVVMVAPYEELLAQTVAGRDFLIVLMALAVIGVLVVVLLATGLFSQKRTEGS